MTTANTSFNSTVIDWVRGQQLLFEEPVCNWFVIPYHI
jgi:hypothetical protein